MNKTQPIYFTFFIKPNFVLNFEFMPFASYFEIVIPIIAHFTRSISLHCCNGAGNGKTVGLTFLTTKTSTHTAHFYTHLVHSKPKSIGHFMLNFGWMLGRTMNCYFIIFRWDRKRGLSFKIKMLLTANH